MCKTTEKINKLKELYGEDQIDKALDLVENILEKGSNVSKYDFISKLTLYSHRLIYGATSPIYQYISGDSDNTIKNINNRMISDKDKLLKQLSKIEDERDYIRNLAKKLIKNEEERILLYHMSMASPLMSWIKDNNGIYKWINKATAKELFNTDNVNDIIGRGDIEIAIELRKKFPNRTFGEICNGTDTITIDKSKPMKYFEWGVIYEKFEYLVVYKSPLYNEVGDLIGTTGMAIYATDEVNKILKIIEKCNCENTVSDLKEYLGKFGFGCDNTFGDKNIEEYEIWQRR